LKYGILTGITRIIKEGIFSGLNNLYVNTVLSKNYAEYFGLLESEVIEMLEYFDMKYKIEEVREWYNGYIFGESEVYNPWSIVNYIREKEIKAYWANVSGNTLLENMLNHAGESVYDDLKRFTDGESIEKYASQISTQMRKGFMAFCVLKVCAKKKPPGQNDPAPAQRGGRMFFGGGCFYFILYAYTLKFLAHLR